MDHRTPRLYVNAPLDVGQGVSLPDSSYHYLKNVLRCNAGDLVRVFNGRDGEWQATFHDAKKKGEVVCESLLRPQSRARTARHLFFPPLKKDRMDFLIEKSVELGVTDLHPVLTDHTDVRSVHPDRLGAQIIEAAEQCERMDLPMLHPLVSLRALLAAWDLSVPGFVALERQGLDLSPLSGSPPGVGCALLVGPPGGFSLDERARLIEVPGLTPVGLGDTILRTETAALLLLARTREEV